MKTASPALIAYLADASENPNDMVVFCVDLYTFTFFNGAVLRVSSGDHPITVGGHTYQTSSQSSPGAEPLINRSKITSKIGLDVTELELDLFCGPLSPTLFGTPLLQCLDNGVFDGVTVLVERLIQLNPTDVSLGTYILFSGTVGDIIEITGTSAKIQVKALTEHLNVQMPRNLIQPGCRHALFDAGCSLAASAFRITGAVTGTPNVLTIPTNLTQPGSLAAPVAAPGLSYSAVSGTNLTLATYYVQVTYVSAFGETVGSPEAFLLVPDNNVLHVASPAALTGATGYNVYVGFSPGAVSKQNGLPIAIGTPWVMGTDGAVQGQPPPDQNSSGWFTQGVITFTSGILNGLAYGVQNYGAGIVTLIIGALAAPSAGDTFTIIPGCDKQLSTCKQKFNNLANFAGTPFVPQPEAAI